MADRHVVGARGLDLLDLVGKRLHQRFELRRHRGARLRALGQRVGDGRNALLEIVERAAAGGGVGDVVDLLAEQLHLGGKRAHRLVGGDMRRHLAQRVDGAFELRHRLRVFLRHDQIDLVGEPVDRVVEADQLLGRRQAAQRVAHFGEAVLDAGERAVCRRRSGGLRRRAG